MDSCLLFLGSFLVRDDIFLKDVISEASALLFEPKIDFKKDIAYLLTIIIDYLTTCIMKDKYLANFVEDSIYHVYNRTNNKELLFKTDENRLFFLRQYAKYLEPFLETFCWTLLPNHFHFLVRVKNREDIKRHLKSVAPEKLKPIEESYLEDKATTELLIEFEWKRFFTSYSMAFNKQHNRAGNLFHRPFKRVLVNKEAHFTQSIIYIHANAFKHGICKNFQEYIWSSWKSITTSNPTKLCRQEVLDWFGGLERFVEAHNNLTGFYYGGEISIEEA